MAACRMSEMYHQHIPVLLRETVENLVTSAEGLYVDATFGRGSHSQAILNQLSENARLIVLDKDPEAIAFAQQLFKEDSRVTIIHGSFAHLKEYLSKLNLIGKVTGILMDLGVSSPQLDNPARGFSFSKDGTLDMRMDTTQGIDAKTWLAMVDEVQLATILWKYGEEKFSRRIARAIVTKRLETPIVSTAQLAEIITHAQPRIAAHKSVKLKHPATRSFQAIRIAVNRELEELEQALDAALESLKINGRLAVISFHSLEDRIVKQFIRLHEKGEMLPRGLPIKGDQHVAKLKSIGKPIKPSAKELNVNPRARSAILRIGEKKS